MADQLKAGDGKAVSGRMPSQKELARFLADTERYGKEAAEHSGFIGSATKLLADQYSLNRKSLSFVRTLAKMDRAKGMTTIRMVAKATVALPPTRWTKTRKPPHGMPKPSKRA